MVGAGILALPLNTLETGLMPSAALLIGLWLYAITGALLIADTSMKGLNSSQSSPANEEAIGLLAAVQRRFGGSAASLYTALYLVLNFLCLVAYIGEAGGTVAALAGVPKTMGEVLFAVLVGGAAFKSDALLDKVNSTVLVGALVAFAAILLIGATRLDDPVLFGDITAVPRALPVLQVAMTFQPVVPALVWRFKQKARQSAALTPTDAPHTQPQGAADEEMSSKLRWSLIIGSGIPLLMYLMWETVFLSSPLARNLKEGLSLYGEGLADDASPAAATVTEVLVAFMGGVPGGGPLVLSFSLAAILTSFLGCVLSQVDTIRQMASLDSLSSKHRPQHDSSEFSRLLPLPPSSSSRLALLPAAVWRLVRRNGSGGSATEPSRSQLYGWSLVPPLLAVLACGEEDVFGRALDLAGAFCDPILFGLVPGLVAYSDIRRRAASAEGESGGFVSESVCVGTIGLSAAFVVEELVRRCITA
ncbi:unnamed protein product [Vitrella brassicaformis CCMP3155]|uniref:Amino acid transporter transmembrane domain-containing protein n=1 Tax=Vitrella brassicaformis (strain CCMP3155) TaxID=1169540 RepID=A0A0G4GSH1_VITBC|nr:unnamed protein product [Vitrella brassicaformis CCMP3155]|eukprot:CEM33421.1 unnamed protein product [Vitrella brassicaformis CCMP3155]